MSTRVYVGGLSHRARERDVEKFFRKYGRIKEISLKNGYCFVEFEDYRDADDAVYECNGKDVLGERVNVEIARGTPHGRDRERWGTHDRGGGGDRGGSRRDRSPRGGRDRRESRDSRGRPVWLEKYGPPTRTDHKVIVENLSSRVSWQAPIALKSGIESRLAFLGVRANTVNGLIAIDDIVVFDGNCQVLPTRAATNPHDCSFDEGDLCGWLVVNPGGTSSDERRPQDWQLADPTHTFAHVKDHTFEVENQGFLYFDAANTQILTWLVSGPIASGQEVCFTFWFRSAAVEGAHLSVKRQYKNGTSSLLWCVKHDAIPSASMDDRSPLPWTPSQVHVPSVDEATLLILEGSSKYRGFALDDIRLFPNEPASKCTTRPEYQSTSTSSIPDDLFVRRTSRASPAASNSLNLVKRRFEETI